MSSINPEKKDEETNYYAWAAVFVVFLVLLAGTLLIFQDYELKEEIRSLEGDIKSLEGENKYLRNELKICKLSSSCIINPQWNVSTCTKYEGGLLVEYDCSLNVLTKVQEMHW